MTRTRRSGRARPMAADERRQAIIDAVTPILLERGPELTTREIADAAGVAEGTLFRVFEDKQELLLATCWNIMDPAKARHWLGGLDSSRSLAELLRDLVETMSAGVERTTRLMFAARSLAAHAASEHGRGPHLHRPPASFFEDSNRAVVEGITGVLRPHADELALAPERAARVVQSVVLGARHPGLGGTVVLSVDEIVSVLLSGITHTEQPDGD